MAGSLWPALFPPSLPPPVARRCSETSQVLQGCPTSHVRSSSACVLRLPDTVCISLLCRQTWDLPVPAQDGSMHAWGLRPRRGQVHLAIAVNPMLPPLISRASAPWRACCFRSKVMISRLNTQPARSSVNASTPPFRAAPHHSRSLWFATPSTYETFTHTTLPVLPAHRNLMKITSAVIFRAWSSSTIILRSRVMGMASL